ncbi:MAG: shikimate dehydrogenase [Propionivibrio sp.]|uniref:shikimate dehydrogenase n=1 Tax=Propionivibrio sp. TaxID=2212460 RepID=UPI001A5C6F8A|nr:shikimate dehydrogenase [Propionivibrio sp.]MBL8415510.1 shikimate dehydrogenase [Propionivibrio sp.]
MTDRYCVFGNPIGHSKSPLIHAAFARQTGEDISYSAILAPLDGFAASVHAFVAAGGRGANVTVPFKEQAWQLVSRRTARAELAGAVNTLVFGNAEIVGDNTDGAGLLLDIALNLRCPLLARRILLLGAGGAARGVSGPLLEARPAALVIANRTAARAHALAGHFAPLGAVTGCSFSELAGQSFDIVINATSASLGDALPPLPPGLFAAGSLAYEMMYGREDTPFLAFARAQGAAQLADGLGMLVEQAAEAFHVWRGVRPDVAPVLAMLRNSGA